MPRCLRSRTSVRVCRGCSMSSHLSWKAGPIAFRGGRSKSLVEHLAWGQAARFRSEDKPWPFVDSLLTTVVERSPEHSEPEP